MRTTPTSRLHDAQSGLPPFSPPRNLNDAVEAARELAEAEVRHYLPEGIRVVDRNEADPDGDSRACSRNTTL